MGFLFLFLFLCYSHKNETRQITQSTKSSMPQGQQGRVLHWPAKAATCCRLLLQLWLPRQVAEALRRRAHRSAHTLPSWHWTSDHSTFKCPADNYESVFADYKGM